MKHGMKTGIAVVLLGTLCALSPSVRAAKAVTAASTAVKPSFGARMQARLTFVRMLKHPRVRAQYKEERRVRQVGATTARAFLRNTVEIAVDLASMAAGYIANANGHPWIGGAATGGGAVRLSFAVIEAGAEFNRVSEKWQWSRVATVRSFRLTPKEQATFERAGWIEPAANR